MADVLIIEAEDCIDWRPDVPPGAGYEAHAAADRHYRRHFTSTHEVEPCVEKAIERARSFISHGGVLNVVVTASGSLMAMIRWNLEIDADPPIEVARFAEPLVLC